LNSSHETLAVVFDFDDTLLPDATTALLQTHGIDTQGFWQHEARELIERGFDPTFAYLKLIVDNIGDGKPLGQLTNSSLREFGASLDGTFYPGIPAIFEALRRIVRQTARDVAIEFYVISGGLQEVMEGCRVIQEHFAGVYGCQLTGDTEEGPLKYIKRAVTFTEKTRYLFEINKGIEPAATRGKPYLVNEDVPVHRRRIPFKNMIFIGDGFTDIPCFSLLKSQGGMSFGVFRPGDEESARRALIKFLVPQRVIGMHAPRYDAESELGSLLRMAVAERCTKIRLERAGAASG
jgi:hypothetical protein